MPMPVQEQYAIAGRRPKLDDSIVAPLVWLTLKHNSWRGFSLRPEDRVRVWADPKVQQWWGSLSPSQRQRYRHDISAPHDFGPAGTDNPTLDPEGWARKVDWFWSLSAHHRQKLRERYELGALEQAGEAVKDVTGTLMKYVPPQVWNAVPAVGPLIHPALVAVNTAARAGLGEKLSVTDIAGAIVKAASAIGGIPDLTQLAAQTGLPIDKVASMVGSAAANVTLAANAGDPKALATVKSLAAKAGAGDLQSRQFLNLINALNEPAKVVKGQAKHAPAHPKSPAAIDYQKMLASAVAGGPPPHPHPHPHHHHHPHHPHAPRPYSASYPYPSSYYAEPLVSEVYVPVPVAVPVPSSDLDLADLLDDTVTSGALSTQLARCTRGYP